MGKTQKTNFRTFKDDSEINSNVNHDEEEHDHDEDEETIELGQTFSIVLMKNDIIECMNGLKESQKNINKTLNTLKSKKTLVIDLSHDQLTEYVLLPEKAILEERIDAFRVTDLIIATGDAW
jgi:hypothetical protein